MRIAASTYLNSAPLVHSFAAGDFGARYTFLGDAAPASCATLLADGQADIALIPVIEYQRIPDLLVFPHIAVASKHHVRSVLLASRKPLTDIQTLALDTSSRTSQALVQIILAERYDVSPELLQHTPKRSPSLAPHQATDFTELFGQADAALIIGDPAMCLAAQADSLNVTIYDLAAEWHALTALPFVFAVWAIRADALAQQSALTSEQLVNDFLTAKAAGLRQLPALATHYLNDLPLSLPELLDYLRVNVNYDLDEENRAGLERYFALAVKHELIAAAQPLRWLGQAETQAKAQTLFG